MRECRDELTKSRRQLQACKNKMCECRDELTKSRRQLQACKNKMRECRDELTKSRRRLQKCQEKLTECDVSLRSVDMSWATITHKLQSVLRDSKSNRRTCKPRLLHSQ